MFLICMGVLFAGCRRYHRYEHLQHQHHRHYHFPLAILAHKLASYLVFAAHHGQSGVGELLLVQPSGAWNVHP